MTSLVGFIPGVQGWSNIHKSINVMHHFNEIEDKNHMIITNGEEKALKTIQHHFIIKISQQMGHKRNVHQHNKSHI